MKDKEINLSNIMPIVEDMVFTLGCNDKVEDNEETNIFIKQLGNELRKIYPHLKGMTDLEIIRESINISKMQNELKK